MERSFLRAVGPVVFGITLFSNAYAQVEHGGVPVSLNRSLEQPVGVRLPNVDVAALAAQDAVNDQDKSIPWRFGKNHAVSLDLDNSGTWTTLDDGSRLWRLGLECPGALSVNFEFHDYRPAPGGRIFVLDQWGGHIGAFTAANDDGGHVLGVQAVKGARIIVEYHVPAAGPRGDLRIGQVTHGYRDVFHYARGLGDSGTCNNNVICPEGDPWRDQIRSVAMITVSGSGICTGTLINNCAQNGTPYFLTANHCLPGNLNVSTWVFRFNWQSGSCASDLNGPTNQTVSGATLLANSAGTDVALLQLNSTPPSTYNVYYSGWDRSGTTPTAQTCIHHPSGDIKKISFDTNSPTQATYGGASCWRIATWEDGTTEPGSSGSGLWDQNKRLIGQLYGGDANCSNNVNDYFGRMDLSFPLLQTWLGTCGNTLNGYDPNAPVLALDAQATSIAGASGNNCSGSVSPTLTVRNGGTTTLTSFLINWSLSTGASGSIPWTGSLISGSSTNVPLGNISLVPGLLTLTATVSAPNGGVDQATGNNAVSSNLSYGPGTVTFNLTLDRYGNETTWLIRTGSTTIASGGPYTQQAANGAYPQAAVNICLPDGCYELVVNDSYGDGMCCSFGNGSFSLSGSGASVTGGTFTTSSVNAFCVQSGVLLNAQVFLEGPYAAGPSMSDALRAGNLIPTTEPYSALGFAQAGGGGGETTTSGVLAVTGTSAIVDWVLVELRSAAPAYTLVATRCGLLQSDGDIVGVDGTSPLRFAVAAGNYFVVVKHRNHLGVMTASAVALSSTAAVVNFRSSAQATYGTDARKTVGSAQALWAGDCNSNGQLLYTGSGNDRDIVLSRIGGTVPTNSVNGYYREDVNLSGTVLYTGSGNDRDIILQNIGGVVPTNARSQQLP
ncbi:MAG: trypsin-like peptidase domain-containing protein [Flavobacteriales bacterium]|nr:trypsin-like peptidase domain-containing protein [Flavobacteriales bacterium]